MTLFEQLAQSPEALAKWLSEEVCCEVCPFDGCPLWRDLSAEFTSDDCEKRITEKLNEEVK